MFQNVQGVPKIQKCTILCFVLTSAHFIYIMFGLTFPSPKKTFFLTRQAAGSLVKNVFLGEGKDEAKPSPFPSPKKTLGGDCHPLGTLRGKFIHFWEGSVGIVECGWF